MAYPAVRTTKEDVVFSFHRRQFFTSDQAEALERRSSFCTRRTAQNVFLRRKSLPRRKRNKETLNALLLLEKTRIRNVRRTSKHFPTIKVDFLTNITLINLISVRYARWAVSRNARTPEPRVNDWPTDLGLISNFLFSGGGSACTARETLNPISQTAKDSPINIILKTVRNRLGNLIKVVWELYEVV